MAPHPSSALCTIQEVRENRTPKSLTPREKSCAYQSVPILQLYVKSPEDPYAKDLVRQLKLVKEGSIHIVKNPATPHQPGYAVVFAPYLGSGGPIPFVHLLDDQALRDFLEKRLGISSNEVDRAIPRVSPKTQYVHF